MAHLRSTLLAFNLKSFFLNKKSQLLNKVLVIFFTQVKSKKSSLAALNFYNLLCRDRIISQPEKLNLFTYKKTIKILLKKKKTLKKSFFFTILFSIKYFLNDFLVFFLNSRFSAISSSSKLVLSVCIYSF